ncbi:Membrane-spanning 4-domains subfamily A member 15 [Anabarilius grahami]|uniref:Membrane-spanning 4-domains subfamily A member 15 n=1 Tax=Anabarilius grahami TaxID=495550 RepID=A0A3N0XK48_ANAGA|nr:Membrane-spanning 4-domains subfamily A member 15 [Anabarilius grahami]
MTLTVSTDLSVNTGPSQVEEKLEDKQKALRESIEKGEPKIFGVSQIVLGLLIISYSMPLLSAEATMLLNFGVPWWSGLMFVISGAAAIAVEKIATVKTLLRLSYTMLTLFPIRQPDANRDQTTFYVMQRPAKGDVNFAPIVVNGTVVRDKEFLRGLGKVLKLQWLLGKSSEA